MYRRLLNSRGRCLMNIFTETLTKALNYWHGTGAAIKTTRGFPIWLPVDDETFLEDCADELFDKSEIGFLVIVILRGSMKSQSIRTQPSGICHLFRNGICPRLFSSQVRATRRIYRSFIYIRKSHISKLHIANQIQKIGRETKKKSLGLSKRY